MRQTTDTDETKRYLKVTFQIFFLSFNGTQTNYNNKKINKMRREKVPVLNGLLQALKCLHVYLVLYHRYITGFA